MMGDRSATYSVIDKAATGKINRKKSRKQKATPSTSAKVTSTKAISQTFSSFETDLFQLKPQNEAQDTMLGNFCVMLTLDFNTGL